MISQQHCFLLSLREISGRAFGMIQASSACLSHTDISIIGSESFFNCDSLTTVSFPGSIPDIGTDAFENTQFDGSDG